jgi:ATP-binding cassette subfamily C protein
MGFKMIEEFKKFRIQTTAGTNLGPIDIKAEELSFGYGAETSQVLDRVSFSVAPGSYVAISGKSGEGKSTLADLILGLREPSSGTIRLNGEAPRFVTRSSHNAVGYVPQSTSLFGGTLLENILLEIAPKNVDEEALDEALEASNLSSLIQSLDKGLATVIGPGGVELSGGQAQRVGLARALYLKPQLLVLDEATSALDSETEEVIHSALLSLKGKVTCLVIAHRPQTLKDADLVLKVQERRVTSIPSS